MQQSFGERRENFKQSTQEWLRKQGDIWVKPEGNMGAMQVAIHGKQDIGGENFKAFDLGNGKEVCVSHNDWAWRKIAEEVQVLNGDRFCRWLDFILNEMEAFNYDLQFKGITWATQSRVHQRSQWKSNEDN